MQHSHEPTIEGVIRKSLRLGEIKEPHKIPFHKQVQSLELIQHIKKPISILDLRFTTKPN